MFRARRVVGWFLAVAAACFAAVLLALNLYVQSQATQSRIQQELSQRLGMPLRIARISVTPWNGLRLSGITIPQGNPGAATPFLDASSVQLRVRLSSLFHQPLVIKQITLVKPQVTWPQNDSGKWRIPARTQRDHNVTGAPPSSSSVERRPAPSSPRTGHEQPFPEPEVQRLKVLDASFRFLDRQQRTVALFDAVQFSSAMRDGNSLRGETRIGKIALRDRFFLTNVRAALRYDPDTFELSQIQARAAKGELAGNFALEPQTQDSPFNVHADFRGVDANELIQGAGGGKDVVRGILEGSVTASGKIADPAALSGTGTLALRGGHVQQFTLLAMVGQLLQIDELSQLDLQQAEARYHLAGTSVMIDQLNLRSPNLAVSANGSIDFDGKIALNSTLTINDKVRGQLFRAMRENFAATDVPGEYSLPFHVGGTLEKPKTDLMQRAVGVDLKNIGGVIDALFGRGKNKKKKEPEPTPQTSPSAESPASAATPAPTP
jgi:hypothetical protein